MFSRAILVLVGYAAKERILHARDLALETSLALLNIGFILRGLVGTRALLEVLCVALRLGLRYDVIGKSTSLNL